MKKLLSLFLSATMFLSPLCNLAAQGYVKQQDLHADLSHIDIEIDKEIFDFSNKIKNTIQESATFINESGSYYSAYTRVLQNFKETPEYKLQPSAVYFLLEKEHNKIIEKLKDSPYYKRHKAAKDWQVEHLVILAITFVPLMRMARTYNSAAMTQSSKFYGIKNINSANSHQFKRMVAVSLGAEMGVFMGGMTVAMEAYAILAERMKNMDIIDHGIVDYDYLHDRQLVDNTNIDSHITSYEKKEQTLHHSYGQTFIAANSFSERKTWENPEIQRSALLLLYGLKYLNAYLDQTDEKNKHDIAVAEYMNLMIPVEFTTSKGVEISRGIGRLFTPAQRDSVRGTLAVLVACEEEVENMNPLERENVIGSNALRCKYDLIY